MTTYCGNCGAPHRATDRFCHTCGKPIAAASGEAPAIAIHGTGSTSAALSAVPVMIRRLPAPMVVAGTIAFLLIVAASAVVVTALLARLGENPGGSGGGSANATGTLRTIDVRNMSAQVPGAWGQVQAEPEVIGVLEPAGNILWLRSGQVGESLSLDGLQQLLLERSAEEAPDARVCAGPESAAVPGLQFEGRFFTICSTRVPQGGGRAVRFAHAYYIATDASGSAIFVMQLSSSPQLLDGFAATVRSLPPPEWKLAQE